MPYVNIIICSPPRIDRNVHNVPFKVYVYDEDSAPLLPAGTLLRVTAWYDNTLNNPRVSDPRNWKGYGNRSTDDMFLNLSRFVSITDEQFEEEQARRAELERQRTINAQNN